MTITLGEALTAGNDQAFDLQDQSITEGYDKAGEKLRQDAGKFDTEALNGGLQSALLKALDIALDDILAQAWSGWSELRQYADPEQTPPEAVNIVTISNHTVESVHEPSVDIVVQGIPAPVHSFKFEVAARFDVHGVNLEVQGGNITGIRLGSLQLGGSVRLGDRTLLEKNVADVAIPGAMRLAEPIPILRRQD